MRFLLPRPLAVTLAVFLAAPIVWADQQADLRQYVAECVANPAIFVMNPPAELRAYADLTPDALEKWRKDVLRNGAVLFLYPSGLPMKLETRADSQADGPSKTWYPDGTLQTDEVFEKEQLRQGKYYDARGALIAGIHDGTGKRIEFTPSLDPAENTIQHETEYVNGVREGRDVSYFEGRMATEIHYRAGKKNGEEKHWAPNGQLSSLATFVDDREEGQATQWYEDGKVRSLTAYEKGVPLGTSRYFPNGQKGFEAIYEGAERVMEMTWYPEGAMALCKKLKDGKVPEAVSFDRDGTRTGEVLGGAGQLLVRVTDDESPRYLAPDKFQIESYKAGRAGEPLPLPAISPASYEETDTGFSIEFRVERAPGFELVESQVLPPANASADPMVWRPGEKKELQIPLPVPFPRWTGPLYGRTKVKGKAGEFAFTQIVFSKDPSLAPATGRKEAVGPSH